MENERLWAEQTEGPQPLLTHLVLWTPLHPTAFLWTPSDGFMSLKLLRAREAQIVSLAISRESSDG